MQAQPRSFAAPATGPAAHGRPDWATDGKDWPNRAASRFCTAGGMRWHVQIGGSGPVLLLLHGTGAATHSWRDMFAGLSQNFTVVAPDLPGHGFTAQPETVGMTLPGMARGIAALLRQLGLPAVYAAGHSAGAAVLAQMSLAGLADFRAVITLNGALLPLPFHGIAKPLIGPITRLFASTPLVPMIFAWQAADGRVIERLLRGTGSVIGPEGTKFYARLARRSGHAGAALKMMANWDLDLLQAALPTFAPPLLLVVGAQDKSIPPADAQRLQKLIGGARVVTLPGGHLLHEERPAEISALIRNFTAEHAG